MPRSRIGELVWLVERGAESAAEFRRRYHAQIPLSVEVEPPHPDIRRDHGNAGAQIVEHLHFVPEPARTGFSATVAIPTRLLELVADHPEQLDVVWSLLGLQWDTNPADDPESHLGNLLCEADDLPRRDQVRLVPASR